MQNQMNNSLHRERSASGFRDLDFVQLGSGVGAGNINNVMVNKSNMEQDLYQRLNIDNANNNNEKE